MNYNDCAIIVSAWRAEKWIEQCLDSIDKQRTLLSWRYQLRLGIDGCESTREVVDKLGYPYYWNPSNKGVYIMRNSLIQVAPVQAYAIFDADDTMKESYLPVLLRLVGTGIVGAGRNILTEAGRRVGGRNGFRTGVCVISQSAMKRLGGYRSDRVGSDADLIWRARALGISVVKAGAILYDRRTISTSLTQSKDTGMKSLFRREIVMRHIELRKKGDLVVVPETTPLKFVRGKR